MKITVTGASGFIGRQLLLKLSAAGHQLHALGRRPVEGAAAFSLWDAIEGEPPVESLASADAIVHLGGEPVAQRWTPEAKRRIRESRVAGTRHLVQALSKLSHPPGVLISASAVGIYGSRGDAVLTEHSKPGEGFLAQLTCDWEHEAEIADALGIRVVAIRTGMVLGHGGAVAKMLPAFKAGIGGRLGSGRQWVSWIHVEDLVDLIIHALGSSLARGPLNGSAPNPVRNDEFTRELARALHRPAILPVPTFALHMLFGEMAEMVLASQRVLPQKTESTGFHFRFPKLGDALAAILS